MALVPAVNAAPGFLTYDGMFLSAEEQNQAGSDLPGLTGDLPVDYDAAAPPDIVWQKTFGGSRDEVLNAIGTGNTSDGGYILAATYTKSSNGDVAGYHGGEDIWVVKLFPNRTIEWQRCLGGSGNESLRSLQTTNDGGYVVLGTTTSTNGNVVGNHGASDIWLVKLSATGSVQWQKCLGGSGFEEKPAIQISASVPGNYLITSTSTSNNGDVSGNHGGTDLWLMQFNLTSRSIEWQKCLGGSRDEYGWTNMFVQENNEHNYVILTNTESNDGDVSGNHGGSDLWLVKMYQNRTIAWQKCIGGSKNETDLKRSVSPQLSQTRDGGYQITGYTESSDGDVSGYHGGGDVFSVKLNASRGIVWKRCLGGSGQDLFLFHKVRADGTVGIYGSTFSSNGDMTASHGGKDFFITSILANGTKTPVKCIGGSRDEDFRSGYILQAGIINALFITNSTDGDVTGNHGGSDLWLVRFDTDENIAKSHCYGGTANDWATKALEISATEYYLFGYTESNDGDISGNHGSKDLWAARVSLTTVSSTITVLVPDGGNSWKQGSTQTINWSYTGSPGPFVKIELLKGMSLNRVITSNTSVGSGGSGYKNWKIPYNQPLGNDYRIRITSISNTAVTDTGNANFTISAGAPITVTVPNGGENWKQGSVQTITWSYTGSPVSQVKIELLKGTTMNRVINTSTPIGSGGSGTYSWTVPYLQVLGTDYRIRINCTGNAALTDTSNANFTISAGAPLTVTVPNGGENWKRGSGRTITWSYTGTLGSRVKIELLKGSAVNRVINASTPIGSRGLGSYNWTVPSTQTTGIDYRIRINSTGNASITDVSNANFTISI